MLEKPKAVCSSCGFCVFTGSHLLNANDPCRFVRNEKRCKGCFIGTIGKDDWSACESCNGEGKDRSNNLQCNTCRGVGWKFVRLGGVLPWPHLG